MALSDAQIFECDGLTRDFTILGEILSESHVRVWIDNVMQSSDDWDLLGSTVIFDIAPSDGANVQFLVSTTGTDFPSNPSAIGDVSININDVITVAANLDIINTTSTNINDVIAVSSNIDNVNEVASNKTNIDNVVNNKTNIDTVATNISKVTIVADDTVAINEIYNNRLEIYEADTNALIATNKASEASTSASNAQLSVWEAEAEAMTSESYATEAVDVFVKEYTSNGDGTFTATITTDYSALHWAEKSKDAAQGDAVNISYDNSGSNLTSNNVQDAITELNDVKTNTSINISSMLKGTFTLSNTIKTKAFDSILYTGNGTSQTVVTGVSTIDFTVPFNGTGYYHDRTAGDGIVKTDAGVAVTSGSIAFKDVAGVDGVCQVHIKARSLAQNSVVSDGLRGSQKGISTDSTNAEFTGSYITSFSNSGFVVGTSSTVNANLATYVSYVTLYTHIDWRTNSRGLFQIVAFNPVTNEYIGMIEQSATAGNEIELPFMEESDLFIAKDLDATVDWFVQAGNMTDTQKLVLNTTAAISAI